MQVKLQFLHLDTSWVLTLKKPRTSVESVLCMKCSISVIISHRPSRGVYRETSWFSAIYAGKIAIFTFGHFVGSNFEKPRTNVESVLSMKCSISYIISHLPPKGFTERLLDFQSFMQVKLFFLHLDTLWVLTLKKPRTSVESVLCMKCSISVIISHRPSRGVYRETSWFSVIYAGKIAFFTFGNFVGSPVLCTKCSISYIISRWPLERVYWKTFWFSAIYAGKNQILSGSGNSWVLTLTGF